jgi:deoxyribonuclease-4
MLLGVHVSISGHIYESINRAEALGCNTMQIFSRDSRQWRKLRIRPEDIEEFRKRRAKSNISAVFIHIPYLINLASPDNILYNGSIRACIEDMREAEAIGAEYLVTHMGSHKKSGEAIGIKRITHALNKILDKTAKSPVCILLENTSGSGSWLGYKFEHQRLIIDGIEDKSRMGVCFDTCHAYTAGYDLASAEGYKEIIAQLDKIVGLKKLKLIHLNDTREKFASHRDKHEHIGRGNIGLKGFSRLVCDPRLKHVAFILETPKDSENADRKNLETIRRLVKKSKV